MQLNGHLAETSLAIVLEDIAQHCLTGTLHLTFKDSSDKKCQVYIVLGQGKILTCHRVPASENLIHELLERECFKANEMQGFLQQSQKQDKRLEKILVEKGGLDLSRLHEIYRDILMERLKPHLRLKTGQYHFKGIEGDGQDVALPDLGLPLDELFYEPGLKVSELLDQVSVVSPASDMPEIVLPEVEDKPLASPFKPIQVEVDLDQEMEGTLGNRSDQFDLSRELGLKGAGLNEDDLDFLQTMLGELNNPGENDITLLLLRFASRALTRGILFKADGNFLKSMGEFGFDDLGEEVMSVLKDLKLSVENLQKEESADLNPLLKAFLKNQVLKEPLPHNWLKNDTGGFFHLLGKSLPQEIFVAPIISRSFPLGLLYGDFGADSTLRDKASKLRGLEIFINQVGMAMERKFLQERLDALEQR